MGLSIYASNDLHELLHHLTARFRAVQLPPLDREWIVVQSRGMARWLDLSFARELGISASVNYCLPKAFCFQITDLLLPNQIETHVPIYEDRQLLSWALLSALPKLLESEAFHPVKTYLREDTSGLKRFQLSHRVAECFDDYQLYRPKMLQRWESVPLDDPELPHETWQRQWWLALRGVSGSKPLHLRLFEAAALLKSSTQHGALPQRISLFGVGSLPPLFLEFLNEIANHCPVSLYVVTPTDAFWGHLRSERQQLLLGQTDVDPLETGHELLASLGRQGKDFFNLLQHLDFSGQAWKPLQFHSPSRKSLLQNLQADMNELRHRVDGSFDPPIMVAKDDSSLQIHVCHGILREVEVIHNLVLDALETMSDLHLQDIIVMVPNIADYAAALQAVFGKSPDDPSYLPFTIADQPLGEEFPLAKGLVTLLETLSGRLSVESVFELFEISALRNKFQIQEADLEMIRNWIFNAGIVWAEDASQRKRDFNLPEFREGTWRNGLDRLLLSYAMGESPTMFGTLAPIPSATTSQATLLGHFVTFAETLFQLRATFSAPHNLSEWADLLTHALSSLFQPESEPEEDALQTIRDTCTQFIQIEEHFLPDQKFSLPIILETLRQLLRDENVGTGFISGKMTFCALKPMRTIPFKLIVIAGLNDGVFPRQLTPQSFDLIAASKQPGDRNIREDDRYLFLEAILAAKEKLLLTYTGHHPATLQSLPASSVIQELLSNLDRSFRTLDGKPISQQILIHHPATPYDRAYFAPNHPELFSYQQGHFQAASATSSLEKKPFLTAPLDAVSVANPITLETFISFWENPSQYFCQHVLNLKFPRAQDRFPMSETLDLGGLAGYRLDQRLFECGITSLEKATPARLQSEGLLPPGNLGQAHFDQRLGKTKPLVELYLNHHLLPPVPFQLPLGAFTLHGSLNQISTEGQVFYRPGTPRPRHWVAVWIQHLILQTLDSSEAPTPRITFLHSLENGLTLAKLNPVPEALTILEQLVANFQAGHSQPLPLFGTTSFDYAESYFKTHDPSSRTRTIQKASNWAPGFRIYNPECENDYHILCFGHFPNYSLEPPESHQALALKFWEPFLQTREG